jgi:hypothetical protein
MQDFRDYLRAYLAHVRKHGWMKALGFALLWVAGMFVPAGARNFVQLPDWLAFSWMFGWAIDGYFLAPYGMWKQQRTAAINSVSPDRN